MNYYIHLNFQPKTGGCTPKLPLWFSLKNENSRRLKKESLKTFKNSEKNLEEALSLVSWYYQTEEPEPPASNKVDSCMRVLMYYASTVLLLQN